jgi:hypothetical protein
MYSFKLVTILFPSFRRVAVKYLWTTRSEEQIGGLAALRMAVDTLDTAVDRPDVNVTLVNVVTDQGWTWAIARSVDRGKPLPLLGGVAKHDGCWSFYIALDPMKLAEHFGPVDTYAVIPIGALFAHVYSECKAIYERTTATR